ncbi:MAG: hypothetical protein L3J10_06325 [Sulfurimonas sp.]|nr:hypothetical protein [Sulfurimonas sp.]
MNEYEDIYFFNSQEAFRVASQQNKYNENNYLQVCYYDGERIDTDLVNLIHLPIENLVEFLAAGEHRIPSKVDFTGLELSSSLKHEITVNFNMSIEHAKSYRNQYVLHYYKEIANAKLDFNEPLRFYLSANANTQVMRHVSETIANVIEAQGYEVDYHLYNGTEDLACLKRIAEFNPHITININHFNNKFLNKNIFNFVWFQDPMPNLLNKNKVKIRERDFVFSLIPELDKLLDSINVPNKRQSFCVNSNVYKVNQEIKREKKIIFIGNSYYSQYYDLDENKYMIKHIINLFENGESFTDLKIEEISKEFLVDKAFLALKIIPYIVRDLSVLWLCSMKSEYEIEVYGNGWDRYDTIAPFYKGVLQYGDDIANVYSGATYAFAPHQTYLLQQRVLEASSCGAIPITYDCRDITSEKIYEEAFCFFKTKKDLENILQNKKIPQKDFDNLLSDNSYNNFIEKMIKIVKENQVNE